MVGNSYPYDLSMWESDMRLAASYGIDAFALNVGSDSWQPARVADAYTAAAATGFKLFMSLVRNDTLALLLDETERVALINRI